MAAWYRSRSCLGDEDRLAAHLDHQRLGRGPQHLGRGHPEAGPPEPLHVVVAAGERHHGVQRQRERAPAHGGLEHAHPVASAGVGQQPALQRRPGGRQPGHQGGQGVVGHGQQGQAGPADDLAGLGDDRAGEVRAGPAHRGVGDRGGRHDLVPGPGQRHAERGARPPGADDADREPGRVPVGRVRPPARPSGAGLLSGFIAVPRITTAGAPGTRWVPGAPAGRLATAR